VYISFCVKVTWPTNALGIGHTQKRTINSSRFSQRLMLPHEDLANCFSLENFKRNMYGTPFYFRNGSRSASAQPGKYSRRGKAWGRREISHLAVFAWLWLVAGTDLLWENSTADWLIAGVDLVWENSTAGWLANKPSEHSDRIRYKLSSNRKFEN